GYVAEIHGEDKAALKAACNFRDPVASFEAGFGELAFFKSDWLSGEIVRDGGGGKRMEDFGKYFAIGGNEDFFQRAALLQYAVNRKCVEKFVRENTAGGDARGKFNRGAALPFLNEMRETSGELLASGGRSLDGDVTERAEKIGKLGSREFQDVAGEAAGAGGGFDQQEFGGTIESLP